MWELQPLLQIKTRENKVVNGMNMTIWKAALVINRVNMLLNLNAKICVIIVIDLGMWHRSQQMMMDLSMGG